MFVQCTVAWISIIKSKAWTLHVRSNTHLCPQSIFRIMRISCKLCNDTHVPTYQGIEIITHRTYCICIIYEPWAVTSMIVSHSCCSFEFKSFLCISPHCCLRSFSYFKQKIRTNNKSELTNWFRRKMKVNCFICMFWRILIETITKFVNWIRMIWNWNVFFFKKLFKYLIATNRRLFCGINHLKQLAKCADSIDTYRWCHNEIIVICLVSNKQL